MMRFLHRQPIEFFVLVIAPFVALVALIAVRPVTLSTIDLPTLRSLVFLLFFGDLAFVLAFALVYFYCFGKIFHHCAQTLCGRTSSLLPFLKSLAYTVACLGSYTALTGVIIGAVSAQSPARILAANATLERWDAAFFDAQPLVTLQAFSLFPAIDVALVVVYKNLALVLSLLALILLFYKSLFRKFILSFALASFFSIPLWYAFPAISPDEMYRKNIFDVKSELPVQNQLARTELSAPLLGFLQSIDGYWSSPATHRFAITSFPSMHVAWGVLIAYFATVLWWPLGAIAIPYALVNAASTVYTLQHYAVDGIAGVFVALLAIILAHYCLALERRYYVDTGWQFAALDIIKEDSFAMLTIVRDAILLRKP